MPAAAAATDSQELLLGLRYYSAETSHFVFRPEQLPLRVLELGLSTVLLTLLLYYTCAEGEEEDGGVVWDDMPSLSRAGSTLPASIPFALGIPCCALLLSVTCWLAYATHAKKLAWSSTRRVPQEHIQATCWSRRCLHVGWCFCVFLGVDCPWPRPCVVRGAQAGLEAMAGVGLMGFVHSLPYDLRDVQLELSI